MPDSANDTADFLWKMASLLGLALAAILWMLKQQQSKTKSDSENKATFETMSKKFGEVDKHLEYQDGRFQDFTDTLGRLSSQISQFGIFDLRLKQLENENSERKEENRLMMRKLDSIFNKMNQIELTVNNKANRS